MTDTRTWPRGDRSITITVCVLPVIAADRTHRNGTADPDRLAKPPFRLVPRRLHACAVVGAGLMCTPLASLAAAYGDTDRAAATWSGARLVEGERVVDGLHRRLGEIRNVMPTENVAGEIFARYAGGRYDRIAGSGDRDARLRAVALQLGAGLAYWSEDDASHRAGWALDRGTLGVRSRGAARAHDQVTGISAWYTHQRANGLYVDVVLRRASHAGRMDGGSRSVAKSRARLWTYSIEAGAPSPLGEDMAIEPQVQLKYRSLSMGRAIRAHQIAARIGARIASIDNERFVPYVQLDLERQFAGRSQVAEAVPIAPRGGTSVTLSAGLTIKLNRSVDFHADAGMQRRLAGSGGAGGSVSAGVRIHF